MKRILFLMVLCFAFFSCVSTSSNALSGFQDFYEPFFSDDQLVQYEGLLLKEGEEPFIEQTSPSRFFQRINEIRSLGYWVLGYGGFNGPAYSLSELEQAVVSLCKEKRAVAAVYCYEYTDTKTGSVPHYNGYTTYDRNGYAHYNTITTYSSYSVDRYDYTVYLLIPLPDDYLYSFIPGISVMDLSQSDRSTFKQNSGVIITTVYVDTPAYDANLFADDIIVQINDTRIRTKNDYDSYWYSAHIGDIWNITFIRDGMRRSVEVPFFPDIYTMEELTGE